MAYNLNLGGYGDLLSLADQQRAASRVASTYPQNEAVMQAARNTRLTDARGGADTGNYGDWKTGLATAQKAGGLLGGNSGLGRVLGLVGMFL